LLVAAGAVGKTVAEEEREVIVALCLESLLVAEHQQNLL
jgi:hypothetical protein